MRQVKHRGSKGSIISISIDGALQLFTRDDVPFSNGYIDSPIFFLHFKELQVGEVSPAHEKHAHDFHLRLPYARPVPCVNFGPGSQTEWDWWLVGWSKGWF